MTPERLRQCCDILCWSAGALALRAEVSPVTARRWLNGQREIPTKVAAAIEAMVTAAAALCSGRSQTSKSTSQLMTNDHPECMRSAVSGGHASPEWDRCSSVLSELAWLQAEDEMTKLLVAPARTDKSGVR